MMDLDGTPSAHHDICRPEDDDHVSRDGQGAAAVAVAAAPPGLVGQGRAPAVESAGSQMGCREATPPSPEEDHDDVDDEFMEVRVSDPQKVGEGMSSFMAYRVTTNTNMRHFRRRSFSVTRRFSDFLGLHEKLVEKHAHQGRIIPPAPEKDLVASTKVKLGGNHQPLHSTTAAAAAQQFGSASINGNAGSPLTAGSATRVTTSAAAAAANSHSKNGDGSLVQKSAASSSSGREFINRRRMALERFANRIVTHPILRVDPDVVEFLESSRDLPRATSTSALSSASVLRLLGKVGDTVNKMSACRMDETDPWYENKVQQLEVMETQLRKLHNLAEAMVQCRSDLAVSTGSFAEAAATLSNTEEAHSLSRALGQLAKVEELVEQVHHQQAEADFYHFYELVKDYVTLMGAVRDALNERSKAFQAWQHAQSMVIKKKEQKARMEMGGKLDKLPGVNEEVAEWENRLEEARNNFVQISDVIKFEIQLFEVYRVRDFKRAIVAYLEALVACQLRLAKHWEDFLPELKGVVLH